MSSKELSYIVWAVIIFKLIIFMNILRREFLMLGLSGITGMAGGIISNLIKNLDFNDYELNFKVNIFSNENKDKVKKTTFREFRIFG